MDGTDLDSGEFLPSEAAEEEARRLAEAEPQMDEEGHDVQVSQTDGAR